MPDFAVIKTGGKQYKVSAGQKLRVEKLNAEAGTTVTFDTVLLTVKGDTAHIGTPTVAGAKVEAKVLRQMRDEKKIIFRFHSKTRYRKKKGHRQPLTELEIVKI
jgi:large subunit ribosomal protein L21